jgi:IS30 family transposase
MDYPNNPVMDISHEAVYAHIYRHRQARLNLKLIALLPLHRTRRKRNYKSRGVAQFRVTDKISIDQRPGFINDRSQIGHWEGDLIIGEKRASALITLVERKTRFTYILKIPNKKSETVTTEIKNLFNRIPTRLRRSITYDNGVEMANHRWLTKMTGAKVYFAHPYSSWERGTNENTNGIIRRFYPKKTDFNKISYDELIVLQHKLNNRPRKVLGYKTSAELFKFNVDHHCYYYNSVNVRK